MSASMVDTAELPATRPAGALAPVEGVHREGVPVGVARSRLVRRRERRQLRRQRRLYATCGLAALVAVLGATIYVVDVVR